MTTLNIITKSWNWAITSPHYYWLLGALVLVILIIFFSIRYRGSYEHLICNAHGSETFRKVDVYLHKKKDEGLYMINGRERKLKPFQLQRIQKTRSLKGRNATIPEFYFSFADDKKVDEKQENENT